MDVNVDIGSQAAGLLQKLADQLGLTVQQILPWYVEQARLEGMLFFVSVVLFIAIMMPLTIWGWRKGDFDNMNRHAFIFCIAAVLLTMSVLPIFVDGPNNVTKILNPQYHAVKMIAKDVGNMVGK